jgi:phosphoribosylanthranilate isomerase
MNLWIKICGLTTDEGVSAAIDAGADAIGFVFAPSKRQVNAERAAMLVRGVPANVIRVAVMQHPAQTLVDEVWDVFHPDVLQTDSEDLQSLTLPHGLMVLPVIRSGRTSPVQLPPRVLFEGPVSGAGIAADWQTASGLARRAQLVLAGGLNEDNVGDAIRTVRPFGVDVSSGVEREPGVKDAGKIREFLRAARGVAHATHDGAGNES